MTRQRLSRQLFGYNREQVDDLVEELNAEIGRLTSQIASLTENVLQLKDTLARYESMRDTLQQTLVTAQKEADDIKNAARREAARAVEEAQVQAAHIVQDAASEKEAAELAYAELLRLRQQSWKEFSALLDGIRQRAAELVPHPEGLEEEVAAAPAPPEKEVAAPPPAEKEVAAVAPTRPAERPGEEAPAEKPPEQVVPQPPPVQRKEEPAAAVERAEEARPRAPQITYGEPQPAPTAAKKALISEPEAPAEKPQNRYPGLKAERTLIVSLLRDLSRQSGVELVALVRRDGSILERLGYPAMSSERLSTLASSLPSGLQKLGVVLDETPVNFIAQYRSGVVGLASWDRDLLLLVVGGPSAIPGVIRSNMIKQTKLLARATRDNQT